MSDRARDMEMVDRYCLISFWDKIDPRQEDIPTRKLVIERLERKLRHMRQRSLAGNWTYSYPEHAMLYKIYQKEVAELQALERRSA